MHYALNFRTFLFSHYFYTGLRIAIGVIGLTLLVYAVTDLATAMTVSIGALCTSLMDNLPSGINLMKWWPAPCCARSLRC